MKKLVLALAALLSLTISPVRAESSHAPGGVEISVEHGRVAHVRAFGYADLEQSVRMRPNTVLRIASLTKQFTAVAILRLAQDGGVALDDSLAMRLPHCPPAWRTITLRQLLSHTSGLTGDLSPLYPHIHDDLTPQQLVDLYAEISPRPSPGAHWEYANLNYWILGLVVEAAASEPYAEYVQTHVLAPAGLASTQMGDQTILIERRARGYERAEDGRVINARHFSTSLGFSAGGYVSTALDLARWYDALGRGRIISPELLRQALTAVTLSSGESTGYGLGWYVSTVDGHTLAHHGGTTFGFRAYVYWRPDEGAFSGVFLNSDGEEPQVRALALLGD